MPCEMQQGCFLKIKTLNHLDEKAAGEIYCCHVLPLAYLAKHSIVNGTNRVRLPEATNTVWCNGNIITSLSF